MDLNSIKTEQRNSRTAQIDTMSTLSMVKLINEEDKKVAAAVGDEAEHIAQAVDVIAAQLKQGGRLVYSGCGTSGRLGVLDAVECPPTYSTDPGEVIGLIAGGNEAIFRAKEGAEDDEALGAEDLKKIGFGSKDVLVGIAASGRTPYVLGAMNYARKQGAHVIGISCNPGSQVEKTAEIAITPTPGPEVVTGSTRMKSGTAQKMVLNMLSTGAMIKLGKVYGNLMVDVKPTNAKLVERCKRIVCEATGVDYDTATEALEKCGYRAKVAIVMLKTGLVHIAAGFQHDNGDLRPIAALFQRLGSRIVIHAGGFTDDALAPLHQLRVGRLHVHHQVAVDLAQLDHRAGGKHIQHHLLGGAALHPGRAGDHLRAGRGSHGDLRVAGQFR